MTRLWRAVAGLGGLLSVAAGAFAAHLGPAAQAAELLRTGALYGLAHAAALLAIATRAAAPPGLAVAAWSFAAGIVLFSFSLFALALTGWRPFAFVTPFGGVAFMIGWLAVALSTWRGG